MRRLFAPMKLELEHIKGDLFGGITTGIVALPLALAFGVASGLERGAQAGLYGAILVGFLAAIFGGTKPQVSGPTGPMTVVAAGFVATASEPRYLFMAVVVGGLVQIAFGILKLGHYIRYVPRPVISGFMTGIGCIIVLIQIQPLLGSPNAAGPLQALGGAKDAIVRANVQALLLGLGTVALIYLIPRITKQIPAALVALLAGTLVAELRGLDVARIGELPKGLPEFQFFVPSANALPQVLLAGLTLAILGSLDTLLGSVVIDQVTKTRHDSDKELVGQGLGNLCAGFFGGLPGAGATMRSLLNVRSGGATGLSGVFHSILLTAILLGLGTYAARIPLAVLAGILVTVGVAIIDYPALRALKTAPASDRVVLLVVLGLTVLVDLITAVQMGFLIATLLFFRELSNRELSTGGTLTKMVLSDNPTSVELASRIQVVQADGPIVFGTSEAFIDSFQNGDDDLRAIIIRATRVPLIDQTGAYAIEEFVRRMQDRSIVVVFSGLPEAPTGVLRSLGVIPKALPDKAMFPTLAEAVEGLNTLLDATPDERLVPQPYLPKVGG